ncbi:Vicilin GC72-A [Hibiscus syriacus]|uniref:Vicilin GC72-A n=1 Tax=Hibiscus syriacus TaxID=106335 RepID=A0A6A2XNB5_HIBSY|nr:vicilin GC72-A-like [Hibiscus syriacus]KAE8663506.1 Vicilin GC72-A [Hibiscus syriacus]
MHVNVLNTLMNISMQRLPFTFFKDTVTLCPIIIMHTPQNITVMVTSKCFLVVLLLSLLHSFALLCSAAYPSGGRSSKEDDPQEDDIGVFNPFFFPQRKFAFGRYQEDNGSLWVLHKFYEKHLILKAYNEYRVALLEANPNTFVLPHHCDADRIYVVTNGKGTLTLLTDKNRESYSLVPGVVVRVPTGTTVYLVNQDDKEKLNIAVLVRPVNNPGKFEEFFPAGQYPQSFYRHLSLDVLEDALNTRSELLDRLLQANQSQQGMFRIASQEQIKTLSKGASTPSEKEEGLAFNLFAQNPKYSNQNGKFFEACPREFELLRDLDAGLVGLELNKGSIFVPHYNTKSTFVIIVTEGSGYVEMVCPIAPEKSYQGEKEEEDEKAQREIEEEIERREEKIAGHYAKMRVLLSAGDVIITPACHPVTYFTPEDQHLRFIAFGLYHQNNTKIFIARKDNVVKQMDSAAKELSFGVPSSLVDEVFNNLPESYFASRQSQQRGSEASNLDFARLF